MSIVTNERPHKLRYYNYSARNDRQDCFNDSATAVGTARLIYYNRALKRIKHFFDKRATKTAQNKQRPICLPGSATFKHNERETCAWFYYSVSCHVRKAVLHGCSTKQETHDNASSTWTMSLNAGNQTYSQLILIIVKHILKMHRI